MENNIFEKIANISNELQAKGAEYANLNREELINIEIIPTDLISFDEKLYKDITRKVGKTIKVQF